MATNIKVGRSVYKGNPLIVLDTESRFPFQFGLGKAKMILACLPEIQRFVAEHSAPASSGNGPDVDRLYEDQCQRQTGA